MANGESKLIEIHCEDIREYFNEHNCEELMNNILKNTKRYKALFSKAVDELMPERRIKIDPVNSFPPSRISHDTG